MRKGRSPCESSFFEECSSDMASSCNKDVVVLGKKDVGEQRIAGGGTMRWGTASDVAKVNSASGVTTEGGTESQGPPIQYAGRT
jgi:hypothetical protein